MTERFIQPAELPEVLISVADARTFVRRLTIDEDLWPQLRAGQWGSHLHRAAVDVALHPEIDKEVDIVPYYIQQRIADPSYKDRRSGNTDPEALRARAVADLLNNKHAVTGPVSSIHNLAIGFGAGGRAE